MVKQCLTFISILDPSDVEAARVIFSGFTERDREAAINSVISSTLFLCSLSCDAIHSRNDQHNLSKAHAHAFPRMINTHDELEREPLTLGTFTEYMTNQLGSPAEAESVPADVCEWTATFVTEAPCLVERDHASGPCFCCAASNQLSAKSLIHSIFSYHSVPRTVSPTMLNGTQ